MGEGLQRWTVGAVTVTGVCEAQTDHIPPQFFFPEATADAVARYDWLRPDHADDAGNVSLRVQAFVVEVGGRTIVVDPCVGNGRQRPTMPFWSMQEWPFMERFESAGFDVDAVATVLHTHLHADHVGWGTRPSPSGDGWVPTFGNARYLYTERELDFARDPSSPSDVWVDSIQPVLDAGLGDVIAEDAGLDDGLRLEPTTGHTPGHVSLWIESDGEVAMISGDWLHHPVQLAEPTWAEIGDRDVEQARETRRRMLARLCETGALLLGTHFGAPSAGRVVADGAAWRFQPAAG